MSLGTAPLSVGDDGVSGKVGIDDPDREAVDSGEDKGSDKGDGSVSREEVVNVSEGDSGPAVGGDEDDEMFGKEGPAEVADDAGSSEDITDCE